MTRVIIVGGGASGVLMAAHLLRRPHSDVQVALVERREELGAGVAFGTNDRSHLLNVRASNMSAFADDEDHFLRWLQEHSLAASLVPSPYYFAPRQLYRDYLAGLLAPHFAAGRLSRVHGLAVEAVEEDAGVGVRMADGTTHRADSLVIATGNEGARLPAAAWRYDGWQTSRPPQLHAHAPVVMIGTGLTMIDWALSLLNRGHLGAITAISPHGLIAHAHRPVRPARINGSELPLGKPLSTLTRWLRDEARSTEAAGGDWRSVVDALRPHTQRLWQALPLDDKQRFLRHARPWWDQHRHRIAPAAMETIADARARGQLRILPARLQGFEEREGGVDVVIARAPGGIEERLFAEAVFECRGRASDVTRSDNRLLQSLLATAQARPDPLRLGLDVTDRCAVIDAHGAASERFFAIGPVTSGVFWESIAVPDIRLQAARIAEALLE